MALCVLVFFPRIGPCDGGGAAPVGLCDDGGRAGCLVAVGTVPFGDGDATRFLGGAEVERCFFGEAFVDGAAIGERLDGRSLSQ